MIGDVGVRAFGIRAEGGRKFYSDAGGAGDDVGVDLADQQNDAEAAGKLYVGTVIMLIFSEALALYGLIVALILSQHNYVCE